MKKIKGSCLCKNITFEIFNECRYSVLCHCTMCQKANAEFSNYTKVKKENIKFLQKKNLKWLGTALVFIGILLMYLNIYPLNIFFHGPGIIAWTIHGYINKDKAVLTNFALQIPFSVIGFYKYFFM